MLSTSPRAGRASGGGRPVNPLPRPRGPLTETLLAALWGTPGDVSQSSLLAPLGAGIDEEDLHLALYCCYELHYGGFDGVDPDWEWEPSLLALRAQLEQVFMADLVATVRRPETDPATVVDRLWALATGDEGPSLSAWVAAHATIGHVRELAVHRSAYQLKEADPHTWGIPRLRGPAKAAMAAIQADEYGNGVADRMHAKLFADTMVSLGLDPDHSYLDLIPAVTLATTNLISLFGLHRRWRGALVGHLALFEMTSVGPMGRYATALRRLGIDEAGCCFYDVHVEADEIHQHVASQGMAGELIRVEPELAGDVIFGAAALGQVEGRFSRYVLDRWADRESSLRSAWQVG